MLKPIIPVLTVLAATFVVPGATAGDLPAGNCEAPQAATDLSRCDFSRRKLVAFLFKYF